MASSVRVALLQMLVTKAKEENIAKAASMVRQAKAGGAAVAVLPECFNCPYGTKYFPDYAEPIDVTGGEPDAAAAPTVKAIRDVAKETGLWVIAGSIPEVADGKLYNSSMAVAPNGTIANVHRKVHLFKINTETVKFDESEVLTGGTTANAVDIGSGVKIGVGICFDIRYPQLALAYQNQGTSVLFYPGAFNMVTGPLHWTLAAQSRAIDTQQYVVLCSPARDTTAEYVAYGHSLAIDPFGKVLVEADEKEGVHFADLPMATIAETRQKLPIVAGTREDLYNLQTSWKQ